MGEAEYAVALVRNWILVSSMESQSYLNLSVELIIYGSSNDGIY